MTLDLKNKVSSVQSNPFYLNPKDPAPPYFFCLFFFSPQIHQTWPQSPALQILSTACLLARAHAAAGHPAQRACSSRGSVAHARLHPHVAAQLGRLSGGVGCALAHAPAHGAAVRSLTCAPAAASPCGGGGACCTPRRPARLSELACG